MKDAEEIIRASFEGSNAVRSAHVHETRHDTNDLSWASTLELIARNRPVTTENVAWHMAADLKYKGCRAEFIAGKLEERRTVERLLNALASIAKPVVEFRR